MYSKLVAVALVWWNLLFRTLAKLLIITAYSVLFCERFVENNNENLGPTSGNIVVEFDELRCFLYS